MTHPTILYSNLRFSAMRVAFDAHGRSLVSSPGQIADHERHLAVGLGELLGDIAALSPPDAATYLVVDEDGTFREAPRGQTRDTVIEDIATGEYEVEQVLHHRGLICEDVTDAIAGEVLTRLERTGPGPKPFIPALLLERLPMEAEALRRSWMTPAEIKAERDELDADRALEALRDLVLQAAE